MVPQGLPPPQILQPPAKAPIQGLTPPQILQSPPAQPPPAKPPQTKLPPASPAVAQQGLPPPKKVYPFKVPPAQPPPGMPSQTEQPLLRRTPSPSPPPAADATVTAVAAVAGAQTAAQGLPATEPPAVEQTLEGRRQLEQVMAEVSLKCDAAPEVIQEVALQLQNQVTETQRRYNDVGVSLSDSDGDDNGDKKGPSSGASGPATQGASGRAAGSSAQDSDDEAGADPGNIQMLRLKCRYKIPTGLFCFQKWSTTVVHRVDLRAVRDAVMASQNGMYVVMKNNIRTLGRPGREQAMKMYKNI